MFQKTILDLFSFECRTKEKNYCVVASYHAHEIDIVKSFASGHTHTMAIHATFLRRN